MTAREYGRVEYRPRTSVQSVQYGCVRGAYAVVTYNGRRETIGSLHATYVEAADALRAYVARLDR